ncbi:hypothetical protein [Stakelama marina]|uniref:Lipoprotein n=1 Tax=Stakelama marina TaxID=2826939 RepID=A0A8T4IJL0_9SPHN|nr:hypothetical protein [Stakelama marina]MBR0552356.1 hypothetical protein [Stakelama marina]
MNLRKTGIVVALATLPLLAGCKRSGEIDPTGGITAVRTTCPTVAVPAGTGDITLFNPADARTANAIDVVATVTNVRSDCGDNGTDVVTTVNFDIEARRNDTSAARDVTLPYFITVVRGGTAVIAKRIKQATVHFDAGQARAQVSAQGTSVINHAAATLPEDVRDRITKKRKAGEQSAAIDPLSDPAVRQAVAAATFETLVGFQLTSDQLKYNLTR